MTTTGEVLKPCPFCGGKAETRLVHDGWCVECQSCFVQAAHDLIEDKSIRAWNRRAPQGNAAQEGYVLVPVEITDEMEQAIFSELGSPSDWHGFKEAYRAMIAAAPSNKEVER